VIFLQVNQEEGESFEALLRRFSQKVKRAGVLSEYKRKRFFVSKGVERREKMKKSQQRQRRKSQRD
jgi:ribosomal protein S21